jgi:hypothetical protein
MLLHITQKQSRELCPAYNPEVLAEAMETMKNADSPEVRILGACSDPPGHALVMIVDAASTESPHKLMDPFLEHWNSLKCVPLPI